MSILKLSDEKQSNSVFSPWLLKAFVTILVFEVVIGGGGRLINLGVFSPRMFLFTIGVLISIIFFIFRPKVNVSILLIFLVFFFYIIYSSFLGLVNTNHIDDIHQDIKPLLYFLLFPFIYAYRELFICNLFTIIKVGAVIMGAVYVLVIGLMKNGVIPFEAIYIINDTGEFFFRGKDAFVYKGFIYLVIGCFLFLTANRKYENFMGLLLLIPIYLLYTRGFIISLAFGVLCYYWLRNKDLDRLKILATIIAFPFLAFAYILTIDRAAGDSKRINDLIFLWENFSDLCNMMFGNGFGEFILGNLKIEVALLEVIFKSGMIGLIFWLLLLIAPIYWYIKSVKKTNFDHSMISILGILYVQSLFNPYINNAIGMLFIMISIVYFNQRSKSIDY